MRPSSGRAHASSANRQAGASRPISTATSSVPSGSTRRQDRNDQLEVVYMDKLPGASASGITIPSAERPLCCVLRVRAARLENPLIKENLASSLAYASRTSGFPNRRCFRSASFVMGSRRRLNRNLQPECFGDLQDRGKCRVALP